MGNQENKNPLTPEEETLVLVRKLWQAEKWRRFLAVLRYVIYIGVILGAFYFLTPYVEWAINLTQQLKGAKDSQELQNILQQLLR